MKTLLYTLAILFTMNGYAQKKMKIKGNKEVIEINENLAAFTSIEVTDGLDITLMQTPNNSYHLKTDSNLVNTVKIEVVDSVLMIYTTHKIKSNKKLEIGVTFQNIDQISIRNAAEIEGLNKFVMDTLTLNSYDNSDFELDVDTKQFNMNLNGSTQGKLHIKSDDAFMVLNDNSYLKGNLSIINLDLTVNKRADMNIEGFTDNLNLVTTGSTDIKAKKLNVANAKLTASNTSDIYVYVSKELNIYAKGKSYIYVYGTPNITVDGLNDKSQIIKK